MKIFNLQKMTLKIFICMVFLFCLIKSDSIYYQDSMMKKISFEENSNVKTLECSSSRSFSRLRNTHIDWEWYDENGNNLKTMNKSTFSINENGRKSFLSFEALQELDGIYVCNILTEEKNENRIFEVFINIKSGNEENSEPASIEHVSVRNITHNSVSFEIKATKTANEFLAIYVEEVENIMMSKKFLAGETISFVNLIPGGKYKFQFLAKPRNDNPWTKIKSVQLLLGPPEVLISRVEEKIVRIEWFHQRDDPEGKRGLVDKYLLTCTKINEKFHEHTIRKGRKNYYELIPSNCTVSIEIPSCHGYNYTITGLESNSIYEIKLKGHNEVGYGKPFISRIRIP